MCSSPFSDDLMFNKWISDKGVNNSSVKLFKAL